MQVVKEPFVSSALYGYGAQIIRICLFVGQQHEFEFVHRESWSFSTITEVHDWTCQCVREWVIKSVRAIFNLRLPVQKSLYHLPRSSSFGVCQPTLSPFLVNANQIDWHTIHSIDLLALVVSVQRVCHRHICLLQNLIVDPASIHAPARFSASLYPIYLNTRERFGYTVDRFDSKPVYWDCSCFSLRFGWTSRFHHSLLLFTFSHPVGYLIPSLSLRFISQSYLSQIPHKFRLAHRWRGGCDARSIFSFFLFLRTLKKITHIYFMKWVWSSRGTLIQGPVKARWFGLPWIAHVLCIPCVRRMRISQSWHHGTWLTLTQTTWYER